MHRRGFFQNFVGTVLGFLGGKGVQAKASSPSISLGNLVSSRLSLIGTALWEHHWMLNSLLNVKGESIGFVLKLYGYFDNSKASEADLNSFRNEMLKPHRSIYLVNQGDCFQFNPEEIIVDISPKGLFYLNVAFDRDKLGTFCVKANLIRSDLLPFSLESEA